MSGLDKSDDDRARRLAEALRENLRRRKAQARGKAEAAKPTAATDDGESGRGEE